MQNSDNSGRGMRILLAAGCLAVLCTAGFARLEARGRAQQAQTAPPSTPAVRPKNHPIPDEFVNLQVLPKDIAKPQLVTVMKGFSVTFGVRCSYCHAVSDDLTEGKFDSDEKEAKRQARELLRAIYSVRIDKKSD